MNPDAFYEDPWEPRWETLEKTWHEIVGEGGVVGPAAAPPSFASNERVAQLCYLLLRTRHRHSRRLRSASASVSGPGGFQRRQKLRDELRAITGYENTSKMVDKFAERLGYSLW